MTDNKKSLAAKLAEVMASVDRVAKTGHNATFNYDFVREADVTEAIRKELSARKVIVVPFLESTGTRTMQTRSGTMEITLALYRFTFYDGESDERIEARVQGEGMDGQDKGSNKALTAALKYLLLKTFLIPTGDDTEADSHESPKPAPARPAAATRPAATAAVPTQVAAVKKPLTEDEKKTLGALFTAIDPVRADEARAAYDAEIKRLGYPKHTDFLAAGGTNIAHFQQVVDSLKGFAKKEAA